MPSKSLYIPGSQPLDYGNLVNRASPLNNGLVSWWLNLPQRGKGNTFFDIAGKNHGTLTNGPTWGGALGRPGGFGSLLFDGTDDCTVASIAAISRPCTVTAWVRPRVSISSGNQWLLAHDSGGNDGWRISRAGGTPEILKLTFGAVADYNFGTLTMGTEDAWYFIAVVVPSNSGTAIGYCAFDGGAIATESVGVGSMAGTPSQFTIGGLSWFSASSDAQIDDVRVFNGSLSESTVNAIYNDSRLGYPQTLNWIRRPMVAQAAGGGGGATPKNVFGKMFSGPFAGVV